MIITATQKNTRQTPRKVRLVANQVKDLSLEDAIVQLGVMQRRASLVLLKVIRQAVANATHNHGFTVSELKLKNIVVHPGPTYKRFQAVSRGRAHGILKRTCHVTVELEAGVAPKAAKKETKESATGKKVDKSVEKSVAKKESKTQKKTTTKKAATKSTKKTTTKSTKSTKGKKTAKK